MVCSLLAKDDEEQYDRYVSNVSNAGFEYTLRWRDILQRHFGFRSRCIIAKDEEGKIVGVLPLFQARGIFGKKLVSSPYAIYTGMLADNGVAREEMMHFAKQLSIQERVKFCEVREQFQDDSYIKRGFRENSTVFNFSLALSSDVDAVWKKLPKGSVRWGVKKAQKSGLQWRCGISERELQGFYALFLQTRKLRGVPGYPYAYFKEILSTFGENARIYVTSYENKPVATIFLIYHKNEVRYAFAGAVHDKTIMQLQPYHLIMWEAIKDACNRGYTTFNFGGATLQTNDGGLYNFKKRWADTVGKAYSYYFLHTMKEVPSSDTAFFALATKLWRKLPLSVVDTLSPFVIRQFV